MVRRDEIVAPAANKSARRPSTRSADYTCPFCGVRCASRAIWDVHQAGCATRPHDPKNSLLLERRREIDETLARVAAEDVEEGAAT